MSSSAAGGPVIVVEHLTKEYVLGARVRGYTTLREAAVTAVSAPLRRARRLARGGSEVQSRPFHALDDISFSVDAGTVVGIVGRNGAGKSTLLRALSRITEPTSGTIAIRGRVASLLEVGTGFHPELTGRENVYLNGSLLGMRRSEIARKFDEIVAFSEVETFLDTPVKRYSSGMYVRLAFAVAAHLEPEILIVDEILAVGDAAFQQKCLGKMQDVGRGGRTVLFVSHNMAAISRLCSRGLLLRHGRLAFDGQTLEAVTRYLADEQRPDSLRWETAGLPRRLDEYGELAKLTVVEVRPASEGQSGFRFGEDLRLRLTFAAISSIHDAAIGVGIDDLYGNRIATFNSDEAGATIAAGRDNTYTVDLRVPNPVLNPGRYAVSCAVLSGARILDFLPQAGFFDVQPIRSDTGEHFEPPAGAGPVRLACSWEIHPAAAPLVSAAVS
jgi:lipopolysaccharide transport system ATP-binding protein